MGIKVEWPKLVEKDPNLLVVLPVDTVWVEDPTKPKFSVVLSDQTASVQQMNFSGSGQVITSGAEFRRRILRKFINENLGYGADHIVLMWDKSSNASPRRIEMYSKKRYQVPLSSKPVPKGKIRGWDGRFYAPAQAPIPKYDETTAFGVKPSQVITESHMYPLPQLLNASWTKNIVAGFICKCLWDYAAGRSEHMIFDTPFVEGDPLCDGQRRCNQPNCIICPDAPIPRHAESDLLYLFHIRHLAGYVPPSTSFLARGSNDRDLLVVLAFPFEQGLVDRVWWCKGTGSYAISSHGTWVTPGPLTGKPMPCNEFVKMKRFVSLLGGKDNTMLLSRLFVLFFFGGDYCDTPKGLTPNGLFTALFAFKRPFIIHSNDTTLTLSIQPLHYFVQMAHDASVRCRSQLDTENLLKSSLDAFYSLAYYTAFHPCFPPTDLSTSVGPDLTQFGYTQGIYHPEPTLLDVFRPMLRPALAGTQESQSIEYCFSALSS
jgi:hypothetical protein